jgi:hypothetical protein
MATGGAPSLRARPKALRRQRRAAGGVSEDRRSLAAHLQRICLSLRIARRFGGLYMAGRTMRPARESFERQRAFIAKPPTSSRRP